MISKAFQTLNQNEYQSADNQSLIFLKISNLLNNDSAIYGHFPNTKSQIKANKLKNELNNNIVEMLMMMLSV